MSGPPRKPTRLRILEGNPSKRPLPNNEPQPDPTMPECPDWLMADAKEEWHRVAPELHRIGLLTIVDQTAWPAIARVTRGGKKRRRKSNSSKTPFTR